MGLRWGLGRDWTRISNSISTCNKNTSKQVGSRNTISQGLVIFVNLCFLLFAGLLVVASWGSCAMRTFLRRSSNAELSADPGCAALDAAIAGDAVGDAAMQQCNNTAMAMDLRFCHLDET